MVIQIFKGTVSRVFKWFEKCRYYSILVFLLSDSVIENGWTVSLLSYHLVLVACSGLNHVVICICISQCISSILLASSVIVGMAT